MSQITFKKRAHLNDSFLTKTQKRSRYISKKTIEASLNLNDFYGEKRFSRKMLYERVKLYIKKDKESLLKRLYNSEITAVERKKLESFLDIIPLTFSFGCFLDHLRRLKNFRVEGTPFFMCGGKGRGLEKKGAVFVVEMAKEAVHKLNKFFYIQKLNRHEKQKLNRPEDKKLNRQIVYIKNLLKSSVSKEQTEISLSQKPTNQPEKSKEVSPREQISSSFDQFSRSSSGTQAYKQALRDLENMGVQQMSLKTIEKTLNHPIARENAILNLRDFLRDLGEKKRQSGINLYLKELKVLNGSMRLIRKGSEKYNTLLEKILNPKPKLASRIISEVILPSEQNVRFGIEPASQEEIEAIWKDFIQRKQKVSTNTNGLDL